MKLCFYQRLAISLVLVFSLILSIILWWVGNLQSITKSEAEQRLHLGLAEHLASDSPLLKEGVYDYKALENLFHTLMVMGPNFEFYYLDTEGKILTYSAEANKVKRADVDLAPIKAFIQNTQELPIYGQDPRNLDKVKIFSAAPVYNNDQLQGYLYVIIGGEIYDSIWDNLRENNAITQFSLIAIGSIVFLLIALLVLFRFFTMPMKRLTEAMEQVREKEFNQSVIEDSFMPWRPNSHDEIQRLGTGFNDMLKHILGQFEQLQNIDNQRRVLLADLSHDLRTPLANLQGYIETLELNNETLSSEERKRFVDISLRNARNLKRLIDQIFELAYIEGGQVTLNQETFPLGELLYDIVAKFELKAKDKQIQLSIEPEKCDFQVMADIGKLERVLTNLLENALRHTPEKGKITLSITPQKDRIRVSVIDTGVGISENEVAFIFDARYQATNTQKDRNLHAGLGLAISKNLMKLLDSDLSVESELGKGTCFRFDLKLAST